MTSDQAKAKNIDEYIADFPEEMQATLQKIRQTIREAAPDAQETIKYDMPTFTLKGNLVSFGVYKKHIGLYPMPGAVEDEALKQELAVYHSAKSSVRFPLDRPIPYDLIGKIVQIRVQEDLARAAAREKKR